MNIPAMVLAAVLGRPQVSCEPSALIGYGWMTSARLEEVADERGISESEAPAVLVLWNSEVCKSDTDSEEAESTSGSESSECARMLEINPESGKSFIELARTEIVESRQEIVSLVWVEPDDKGRPVHHIVVASSAGAIELRHSGYGRDGAVEPVCIANPWKAK